MTKEAIKRLPTKTPPKRDPLRLNYDAEQVACFIDFMKDRGQYKSVNVYCGEFPNADMKTLNELSLAYENNTEFKAEVDEGIEILGHHEKGTLPDIPEKAKKEIDFLFKKYRKRFFPKK